MNCAWVHDCFTRGQEKEQIIKKQTAQVGTVEGALRMRERALRRKRRCEGADGMRAGAGKRASMVHGDDREVTSRRNGS